MRWIIMTNTIDIKGNISIHTENILPIIKKWLYSENEIFVRELCSNACDAIGKLKKLAVLEDKVTAPKKEEINIVIDEKEKTITFKDSGLGLDAEEIQKYINQIAFSGAEDFIEKYKDKDDGQQIIGHFGLGFYSSFIVSDLVEINSLSYKKDAKSVKWSCDGGTQFTIVEGDRTEVGTDIILHVSDESKNYLNESKLSDLVKKYANFLPVDIQVNGKTVNSQSPLWQKNPKEVKDEEYIAFYKTLFPYNQDPLFWIHLNVDYPFNLQGILYFPKILHELDANKGKIQLFCNQVFVTDEAKDIVPEFLTLLQGAIDCPDIPLNVSRSYLQNDPYVQKISNHIVKKIADKLNELYKKNRDDYEKYWDDIHHFLKYGMMNHDDFYKKAKDIILFESTHSDKKTTLVDYKERNKEKLEKKMLYCADKAGQQTYVDLCKEQGLEVLFTKSVIDSHFLQFLESKETESKFVSVDSDLSEYLANDEPSDEDKNKDEDKDKKKPKKSSPFDTLEKAFKEAINKETIKIKTQSLKSDKVPAMILESEQSKRFKQMSAMMQGGNAIPSFDDYTLVLNSNHPLTKKVQSLASDASKKEMVSTLCHHIYDSALMGQQTLSGEQMQAYIQRSNELMLKLSQTL